MVDGEHVDAAPVVRQLPARAARRRVPARHGRRRPDVGEPRDLPLRRPPVPRDQPVGPVRARHRRQAARRVVVALVVRHCGFARGVRM